VSSVGDPAAIRAADPARMLDAFLSLPQQMAASYESARGVDADAFAPTSVTFCGMGGSGAAGDVLTAAYQERLLIPIGSHRGYAMPGHCGPGDLVVCLSYSGNTDETLAAHDEAIARGCRIVAVCAGGELEARGKSGRTVVYGVPEGLPMPRAALGHLTGAALGALASLDIVPEPAPQVEEAGRALVGQAEELTLEAGGGEGAQLAGWIGDRVPIVWGSEGLAEPAAWRWKCAFNENAKLPAFASSLPELDHHEVAGWSPGRGEGFALVVLRHEGEHPSVEPRLRATLEAVAPSGLEAREVRARGRSPLARVLSLMLLGDVTSTYHALSRGIDPAPIEAIDRVKARLAEGAG
jgi:glucose/mannose-6-phosphate isomerase